MQLTLVCISAGSSVIAVSHLPASSTSSSTAAVPQVSTSANATLLRASAVVLPFNRAAFDRKRKIAVAAQHVQDTKKSAKYAPAENKVEPTRWPLTVQPLSATRSWVWDHFKKITVKDASPEIKAWSDTHASCDICYDFALTDDTIKWSVPYTDARSPGHLERHLKYYHNEILVAKRKATAVNVQQGKGIMSYYKKHGDFEDKYLRWAVHTYQPLNTCEGSHFKKMCLSLSPDCPALTKLSVMKKLLQEEQNIKQQFRKALKCQYVSVTLDHWTSNTNVGYCCLTGHVINETWEIVPYTLDCSVHVGGSSGDLTKVVCNF
jgi:hypothetical protein